jgi:4'-phosphopantetheinyl transferase
MRNSFGILGKGGVASVSAANAYIEGVWWGPGKEAGGMPEAGGCLRNDRVNVGFATLDRSGEILRAFGAILSEDERARAARFRFEIHRTRFVCARGLLRRVLGAELGIAPDRVAFIYGPHGKPALAPAQAESGWRFNVSHSDGLGLFALARGRELGADVERIRPVGYGRAVARRFFAADEREALRGHEGESWNRAFFRCWTRKEAFIKAVGDGLSHPLRAFSVTVAEGQPARLIRVDGDPAALDHFWLAALDPGPGFVGALVAEGRPGSIVPFDVDARAAAEAAS